MAPAILALLGDGTLRSGKAIVAALAGRHSKDDDVALTLIRLAVTDGWPSSAASSSCPERTRRSLRIDSRTSAAAASRYLRATRATHEIEANAARNSVLASSIGVVHGLSRRFRYTSIEDTGGFPEASAIHATTLSAIAAGDADRAAASAETSWATWRN